MDASSFGFGEGNPDQIARGRRRTVTYLAFFNFCFVVGSIYPTSDWVKGGLEFTLSSAQQQHLSAGELDSVLAEVSASGCGVQSAGLGAPRLGADASQLFQFTVTSAIVSRSSTFTYSGDNLIYDCTYDLAPFVKEINAAATQPNCTAGFRNPWCGDKKVDITVFQATQGLGGFAAFSQMLAWLTLFGQANDVPYLGNHRFVFETAFASQLAAGAFSAIAFANFAASGLKTELCATLDPDERYNGLPCGFSDGFNLAVAAAVIGLINAAAIYFWAPRGASARYEFSNVDSAKSVPFSAGAPPAAGGAAYQDFGSASSSL